MPLPIKRIVCAAIAVATYGSVPMAASAGVVVASSGPSAGDFPVGKKLGGSERIVLRSGDTLTVLDGNGTRVLRGAGTYSLDQRAGPSQRTAFAALTERRSARRVTTGAVRAEDEGSPSKPPSLWYVDVARAGKFCLGADERVRLWRSTIEGDATYSLRAASGDRHTVTFADGEMLAPWDTKVLPVADDAVFGLSGPEGGEERELRFALLDTIAEEPEALADQLIENGCTGQLELLSAATMIAEG